MSGVAPSEHRILNIECPNTVSEHSRRGSSHQHSHNRGRIGSTGCKNPSVKGAEAKRGEHRTMNGEPRRGNVTTAAMEGQFSDRTMEQARRPYPL